MTDDIKHNDPIKNEYSLNSLIRVDSLNENAIPYITDLLISEVTGFSKKYVDRKIRTHYKRLSKLDKRGIEFSFIKSNKGGKRLKIYKLTRKQAIFLCNTFDDSEFILDFKSQLANSFIDAITLLKERQLIHRSSKPVTKSLTDVIKDSTAIHGNGYINVWNEIYKASLNKTTQRLKKEHNVPKGKNTLDYLSVEELSAVNKIKPIVIGLVSAGLNCKEIGQSLVVIKNKITIERPKKIMLPMVL